MKFQNSVNMINLLERKFTKLESSLQENESVQIGTSKNIINTSFENKHEQELNKMFTKLEVAQSIVFENVKNTESFKNEEENYINTQIEKKNLFQRLFTKTQTKNFSVVNQLPENFAKINKEDLFKLKDDEIIDKISNHKIFYILNVWQNLPVKER